MQTGRTSAIRLDPGSNQIDIVVTAPDGETTRTYLLTVNRNDLTQQAYIKPSNMEAQDVFGVAVALSGETLVVGAFREDSNATEVNGDETNNDRLDSGAAYVFVREGNTWMQQAYLKASNPDPDDLFGDFGAAVSGDTVVVPAAGEESASNQINGDQSDNTADNAGAVYVFQ